MINDGKTWGVITLIIVAISGYLLFSTFKSKEFEKHLRMQKEQEIAAKTTELSQIQNELEQLKKDRAAAEEKYQTSLSALQASVEEYKKSADALNSRLVTLTKEKEASAKLMDSNLLVAAKLSKKIKKLEEDKAQLEEKIKQTEQEKSDNAVIQKTSEPEDDEKEKGDLQQKPPPTDIVDLGKIIIHKTSNQAAIVEHVNALYGFVVISAGKDDGLRKDSIVNITRNDRFIAKAVLEEVRANVSSAVTLPEWTREEIKVGDLISVSDTKETKPALVA